MDFSSLSNEVVGFLDLVKPEALEKLGPYGATVALVGQTIAASAILLVIIFGRSRWGPPTPAMPALPVYGAAIIVSIGLLIIHSQSARTTANVNLWLWFFVLVAVGLVFLIVYFILKSLLCFSCDADPSVYVAGLWLKKQARFVLKGEVNKLTGEYILHTRADGSLDIPNSSKDFFCRTKKGPNFVWHEWSVVISRIILIVTFWLAISPFPLALFAGSAALTQPDLRVDSRSITLPADVLFAFNSADIRTTAVSSLADAAETIRTKGISHARIEGHADGRGDPAYNRDLSLRRAKSVKAWLIDKEGLREVAFDTIGFGADRPIAIETHGGEDDPHARQLNRRVEIQLLQ